MQTVLLFTQCVVNSKKVKEFSCEFVFMRKSFYDKHVAVATVNAPTFIHS